MADQTLSTIPEYSPTAVALADLRQRLKDVVYDVSTGKGMDVAKKDRAEVRGLRVALEAERVRIKAPALERCRAIDAEAKSLTAQLVELESPIDAQIKSEEQRKEREKAAAEEAERQRIAAINARFDAIRTLPRQAIGATVDVIEALLAEGLAVDVSTFPKESQAAAQYEKTVAVGALRDALRARQDADAEAVKVAAQLAELVELKARDAERQAELDRLAAAERERETAEARRLEEAARREREAVEAAERTAREAEQTRIDAERAERRRQEDAEREAAAAELRRKAQDVADERERLDRERRESEAKAKRDAIASATLQSAAREALDLLASEGYAEHLTTQKLAAALARDPLAIAA